jgi:hypothetical protein
MCKRSYLLLAMFLVCVYTVPANAVDTIADVKTLGDLRGLPVIHLENGWDVRIGLKDPDADAGPYRLIYCLASATNTDPRQLGDGEFGLGPVSVDLIDQKIAESKKALDVVKSFGKGEKLFCQVLPIGWKDDLLIRVRQGKRIVLEKQLGKSKHEPFCWTQFSTRQPVKSDHPEYVISTSSAAECPSIYGWASILQTWSSTDSAASPQTPPVDSPLPGDGNLPGKWRDYFLPNIKSDDVLVLNIEHDKFTLQAVDDILESSPPSHLLGRWWVNDAPINAKPDEEAEAQQEMAALQERTTNTDHLEISMGLPLFLGQLKIGDHVGLQVMYAPSVQRIVNRRMARLHSQMKAAEHSVSVPLVTNRVDFTIDEHLLGLVAKQKE